MDLPTLRRATADDLSALKVLDGRAFLASWDDAEFEGFTRVWQPERFVLAVETDGPHPATDPESVVGAAGTYPFSLTVPGGARLPAGGVTWVAVALHQRRRGLLGRMLRDLHAGLAAGGVPLAVLTASESAIYGRFGYAAATTNRFVRVDRRRARLTAAAEALAGPVVARQADPARVRDHLADVHARWCALTPGALDRTPERWDWLLADAPGLRDGASERFALVHPDGFATYRVRDRAVEVADLFATTDEAHASLWRSLLALDLAPHVDAGRAVALDDPLPHLLTDARLVETGKLEDGLWVRLLDVPAALAARRYSCEVDLVLDVLDPAAQASGVDAAARVRLRGGPDGAECTRTDALADVTLPASALAATYLGGPRLGQLARAGQVDGGRAAVARLATALGGEREPRYGTGF